MEEIYYEKILVSSGEVPKVTGDYDTDDGMWKFDTSVGLFTMQKEDDNVYCSYKVELGHFKWWMKPVPSPKQEAVEFAYWLISENYMNAFNHINYHDIWFQHGKPNEEYTLSELYDKFKEKGE